MSIKKFLNREKWLFFAIMMGIIIGAMVFKITENQKKDQIRASYNLGHDDGYLEGLARGLEVVEENENNILPHMQFFRNSNVIPIQHERWPIPASDSCLLAEVSINYDVGIITLICEEGNNFILIPQ